MEIILERDEIEKLVKKYFANQGIKVNEVIIDYDYDEDYYGHKNYKVIGVIKRYVVIDHETYFAQKEFDEDGIQEIITDFFKLANVDIDKINFEIIIPYDQRDVLEIKAKLKLKEKVRGRNIENDTKY